MANPARNDRVFASLFKNDVGWALWNNFSARDLTPGSFGYFDVDGAWKEIALLTDDEQLRRDDWVRLEKLVDVQRNEGRIAWGPKLSGQIQGWGADLGAGGPLLPGLELSATFKLKAGSEHGAVMLTTAPITQSMTVDDRPLLQWVKNNAGKLVDRYREQIKEHGLWIVTKTYQTSRCASLLLRSKSSEATIGLVVDATGVASLGPEVSWRSMSQGADSVLHEDDHNGVVVFMCGFYVRKRLMKEDVKLKTRKEHQSIFRGEEEIDDMQVEEEYCVEVEDMQLSVQKFH